MGERVDVEHVVKLAKLSKLALDSGECEAVARELGSILEYADRLGRLDLEGVEPLTSPVLASGPMGGDVAEGMLERGEVLRLAAGGSGAGVDGVFVKVPKVLGGGGGS